MLIKRIYQADPMRCPNCGGTMKIIAFIERHQSQVIENILRQSGLWQDPPSRAPPPDSPPMSPSTAAHEADSHPGPRLEPDPDFLDYARREETSGGGGSGGLWEA